MSGSNSHASAAPTAMAEQELLHDAARTRSAARSTTGAAVTVTTCAPARCSPPPSPAPSCWRRAPTTMTTTTGQNDCARGPAPASAPATDGSAPAGEDRGGRGRRRARADEPRHRHGRRRGARPGPARQRLRDAARRSTTTGEIEPGLAELPEVSEDGTVYTFTLQDGVDVPQRRAADVGRRRVVARRPARRGRQRGRAAGRHRLGRGARRRRRSSSRSPSPTTTSLYRMTRRGGAVLQADATGLENTRQRHRAVHVRRVERRVVDHARPQRRLLGRGAGDQRRHVPVLHRPERRRQRLHDRRRRHPHRRQHRPRRAAAGQPRLRRQRGHDERRVHARA